MNNKLKKLTLLMALTVAVPVVAQDSQRMSSSLYLQADTIAHVTLPFSVKEEGRRFTPIWGLDQAWISEQNLRKGICHMGKENIGIGRTAYRFKEPLTNDSVLSSDALKYLKERNRIFNILSPTLPLVFTADQEAGTNEYFVRNKSADVQRWAANINSHVHWMQANTKHPMGGISVFNEPDYWSVEEGATTEKSRLVAKLLKESYPRCADIPMVGGNTLNDDKALEWYSSGKDYYDWGNTHQLAGSMANYIKFYKQLQQDGKVGYNDEMHNVAEAMIGLEYGMTVGIWWGFDSRARGEFCDISRNGRRLAYVEHRDNWTSASVWQHDDGRVKAFIGSSERQAYTTDYQLLSLDREVYFDGRGPVRELRMQIPGGTGYQKGQTNAERVIDITWGDDVPPCAVDNGIYKLVNKATGNVIAASSGNIVLQKFVSTNKLQQWNVKPCSPRIGGDYSFYDIESVTNHKLRMNIKDFSTAEGANVMVYDQYENPGSNEQWYLQYAGDGYYYIRSRETAAYLSAASDSKGDGTNVVMRSLLAQNLRGRQMWRLLPLDIAYETEAPARPEGLVAEAQQASVRLSWTANSEDDVTGYMILRAEQGTDDWNTIARCINATLYVDNTCSVGKTYIYKVKAIDEAMNQSACSEVAQAQPTGEQGLVAQWCFRGTLNDETPNMFDAVSHLDPVIEQRDDRNVLNLRTGTNFIQLPYEVAASDELTVAMWVNWRNNDYSWQRLFDFGNGTDQYLFLTPSTNEKVMRFAIKNGGEEQVLDCKAPLERTKWKHVAVSIGKDRTVIYIDGEEAAATTGITIKPSDIHPVLNYIGRSQYSADALLKAFVSDVRIYNYALSGDAVKAVMNNESSAVKDIEKAEQQEQGARYTLDGRPADAHQRGIVIDGNRKRIVK